MGSDSAASSRPPDAAPLVSDAVLASLLSAVAGYVDTAGFIGLFGLFTAHVTGNLVTVGSALSYRGGTDAAPRLMMLPIFMLAVAATVLVIRGLRRRRRPVLPPLLILEALALGGFLVTGVLLTPTGPSLHEGWSIAAIGAAGVIAMGIQNALMRDVLTGSAPTTMMTGNVTQFTIDLTDWLLPGDGPDGLARRTQARKRLAKTGGILGGFVAGAALGALGMHHLGFWSIALPMLAVAALAGTTGRPQS